MKSKESELKSLYKMIGDDKLWTSAIQTTFTDLDAITIYTLKALLPCKNILVMLNPEIVIYLIELGVLPNSITFMSDDPLKEEIFLEPSYGHSIKVIKYNMENIMKNYNKFDGGAINPAFSISTEMRNMMQQLVNGNLIMILPNRDLMTTESLRNIVYYKNLGNSAFDEQINTSLLIINCANTKIDTVIVETRDGLERKSVDKLILLPDNNLKDWEYANNVTELGLPGYNVITSKLNFDQCIMDPNGIPVIFNTGGYNNKSKIVNIKKNKKIVGLGEWKVVISRIGNPYYRNYAMIVGPQVGIGGNVVGVVVDSETDAEKLLEYYNSAKIEKLIKGFKTGKTNGNDFWEKIPHIDHLSDWDHIT